jgi:hypothetical protein
MCVQNASWLGDVPSVRRADSLSRSAALQSPKHVGSQNQLENEYIHSFTACLPIRKLSSNVVVVEVLTYTSRAHLRQHFAHRVQFLEACGGIWL